MKKIIKILQSNAEPLIIEDENEDELSEYTQELSKILSAGNIVILETSSSNIIIRPKQIVSVIVHQEGRKKRVYNKKPKVKKEEVKKEPETNSEDIITDA